MKSLRRHIFVASTAVVCAGCAHRIPLIHHVSPPPPITLACSANPASVFPGDPVTVTGTAGAVLPKLAPTYTWTGTGVTGNGETATVATAGLAPGSHTVTGTMKEGKGDKPWEMATCSATFTVRPFEPPTLSCSVTPTTIKPGDSAKVTATGMSPQNRPLTYSYSASAGSVTRSGTTATFSSTGAPTGLVMITGTVTDDKGQTASCTTGLTIAAPSAPPSPRIQALCSIRFSNDKRNPTRVDNEAKACLDQVALNLQMQSDAKLVVVGNATVAEPRDFAAQRAVNVKDYLISVKDTIIDASRIGVATGSADSQTVNNYLVPAGASFTEDVPGMMPVDESVIKPLNRPPQSNLTGEQTSAAKGAKTGELGGTQAACKAFVVSSYPDPIDLEEAPATAFLLIAGNFDPAGGMDSEQLTSLICKGAGLKTDCISSAEWKNVISDCRQIAPHQIGSPKAEYEYQLWTLQASLPDTVCPTASFPSVWIDKRDHPDDHCKTNGGGIVSWRWFGHIKYKRYDGKGANSLEFSITEKTAEGRSLFKQEVDLTPRPLSIPGRIWDWAKESVEHFLPEWIFGSGGLIALLIAAIKRKLPWQNRESEIQTHPGQESQPEKPVVIVVSPQMRQPDQEGLRGRVGSRRRPRSHRRPPQDEP